ncbi:hypothetical protein BX616_010046 [Lobosporangium transversale]|uniref:Uncharacterized protein n=1 Tax=Lobosporangium transversale TaxID=64571 RepID=A0A1Y2GES4_9FUNG|nr:hypothetical protein BCR41DRAFT_424573 [Lobosporangium transversale]KAF9918174.1 hypothetical protein BX616_010046 [Lobosporangium transversale]ORZ07948.1 hypothetical protein BCR41DRAFT_424573 [Lobosporangium transversale]|eukprot:XP_021878182.1 hypothetical protein BCR41DRAFT_424573 [Lobosporangium transversale]
MFSSFSSFTSRAWPKNTTENRNEGSARPRYSLYRSSYASIFATPSVAVTASNVVLEMRDLSTNDAATSIEREPVTVPATAFNISEQDMRLNSELIQLALDWALRLDGRRDQIEEGTEDECGHRRGRGCERGRLSFFQYFRQFFQGDGNAWRLSYGPQSLGLSFFFSLFPVAGILICFSLSYFLVFRPLSQLKIRESERRILRTFLLKCIALDVAVRYRLEDLPRADYVFNRRMVQKAQVYVIEHADRCTQAINRANVSIAASIRAQSSVLQTGSLHPAASLHHLYYYSHYSTIHGFPETGLYTGNLMDGQNTISTERGQLQRAQSVLSAPARLEGQSRAMVMNKEQHSSQQTQLQGMAAVKAELRSTESWIQRIGSAFRLDKRGIYVPVTPKKERLHLSDIFKSPSSEQPTRQQKQKWAKRHDQDPNMTAGNSAYRQQNAAELPAAGVGTPSSSGSHHLRYCKNTTSSFFCHQASLPVGSSVVSPSNSAVVNRGRDRVDRSLSLKRTISYDHASDSLNPESENYAEHYSDDKEGTSEALQQHGYMVGSLRHYHHAAAKRVRPPLPLVQPMHISVIPRFRNKDLEYMGPVDKKNAHILHRNTSPRNLRGRREREQQQLLRLTGGQETTEITSTVNALSLTTKSNPKSRLMQQLQHRQQTHRGYEIALGQSFHPSQRQSDNHGDYSRQSCNHRAQKTTTSPLEVSCQHARIPCLDATPSNVGTVQAIMGAVMSNITGIESTVVSSPVSKMTKKSTNTQAPGKVPAHSEQQQQHSEMSSTPNKKGTRSQDQAQAQSKGSSHDVQQNVETTPTTTKKQHHGSNRRTSGSHPQKIDNTH